MTTLAVVLGSIVGYFAIGAVYARSQAVRVWKEAYTAERRSTPVSRYRDLAEEWDRRDRRWADESMRIRVAWRALFWPYALLFDTLRGPVVSWFTGPVVERQQRAEQLRSDARAWDEKRYDGTPAERAMARELADMCRERAREVDL